MVALAQEMASSPTGILQKLVETALTLCRAHSAGLSLLEDDDHQKAFHWRAIAGVWASHLGGGTPRDFGPCGAVLDRNAPQVISHPERDFPYFGEVSPLVEDGLLIPLYIAGKPVGTIWIVAHDASRRFDAEDLRMMNSLGIFAAAAYQTYLALKEANQSMRDLERSGMALHHLAAIVESSDDVIVSKTLDGIITSWNAGAERIFGYPAEEIIGKPASTLIPIDRPDEEPMILERVRSGQRIDHYETVRRRKDGSLIDISLTVSPIKNPQGVIVGASKIARDITERRRAQEQQKLLNNEMRHRVKNLLAVAGGLVALSARSARTPQEMATAVRDRLMALTRAHELTRPGLIDSPDKGLEDTSFYVLARMILAPYQSAFPEDHQSMTLSGLDVRIGANSATNVALVLHELATNAAKYGALSSPAGVVHIDCDLEGDKLRVTWKERGGPLLAGPPTGEGFGSVLARRIVTQQFGGTLSNEWEPEGLTVRISVPAKRLES